MKTAVLVDGAYFIKRVRHLDPTLAYDAKEMAKLVTTIALKHVNSKHDKLPAYQLYRIFFYDCPPLEKKLHNPITKKSLDFSKSKEAVFRNALHQELRTKRKVALRLGRLAGDIHWVFKPAVMDKLLKNQMALAAVTEDDVIPSFRQKGVDVVEQVKK